MKEVYKKFAEKRTNGQWFIKASKLQKIFGGEMTLGHFEVFVD